MDITSLSQMLQKKAFYDAGGTDPGTSPIDQFFGQAKNVSAIGGDYLGIVKQVLANKQTALENQKKELDSAPYADIALPITKANMTRDENTTPEQIAQQDTLASQREAMGGITLAQMKTKSEIDASGVRSAAAMAKAQDSGLSPEALDVQADMYIKTGQLPALGMGSSGMRAKILNHAAEKLAGAGHGANAVIANKLALTAGQAELSNLQKQRGAIEAFAKTSKANLKNYLDASNEFMNSGVAWVNKPVQWLEKNVASEPGIAKYLALHHVAVNEAARVLQGNMSGVLTDSAKAELNNVLSPTYTPMQTTAAVNALLTDISNREAGFASQIAETKASVFDAQNFAPQTHAQAGSTETAPASTPPPPRVNPNQYDGFLKSFGSARAAANALSAQMRVPMAQAEGIVKDYLARNPTQ